MVFKKKTYIIYIGCYIKWLAYQFPNSPPYWKGATGAGLNTEVDMGALKWTEIFVTLGFTSITPNHMNNMNSFYKKL